MAITNAQQYQQLVNPPMKGNKRPGYRGDDAYGGGRDPSDPSGDKGMGNREKYSATATQLGPKSRSNTQDKDEKNILEKGFDFYKKISPTYNFVRGVRSLLGPKNLGIRDGYNMANIAGPSSIDDDDDDTNNEDGQSIFLSPMVAQAPSIVEQEPVVEEEEPFEFARRYRAEGGIMNTDVVGGEMDFESARQMYGLGKLVKKVTRTVKKIAKSPIGKAALVGGGLGLAGIGPLQDLRQTGFGKGLAGFFGEGSFNPLRRIVGADKDPFFSPFGELIGKVGPGTLIAGASAISGLLTAEQEEEAQNIADETGIDIAEIRANPNKYLARRFRAEGGSMDEPVAKKTMPLLDMGGKEMDLRAEGGFVPIGRMEKADDVPARLSKNEFVFTADAVRNAGEGDVDKGAEVMYNMMKNLESGGDVSEESQGLEGARKMFQTSQRLEEVL